MERALRFWINFVISENTSFQLAEPLWESISDGFGLAYLAETLLNKQNKIVKQLKERPQFLLNVTPT